MYFCFGVVFGLVLLGSCEVVSICVSPFLPCFVHLVLPPTSDIIGP